LRLDERGGVQFNNERADHGSAGVVFGVEELADDQVDERASHSINSERSIKISALPFEDKSLNLPPAGHQAFLNRAPLQIRPPLINIKRVVQHFVHLRQLNYPQDGHVKHSHLLREHRPHLDQTAGQES
jgi:hypothetical protein